MKNRIDFRHAHRLERARKVRELTHAHGVNDVCIASTNCLDTTSSLTFRRRWDDVVESLSLVGVPRDDDVSIHFVDPRSSGSKRWPGGSGSRLSVKAVGRQLPLRLASVNPCVRHPAPNTLWENSHCSLGSRRSGEAVVGASRRTLQSNKRGGRTACGVPLALGLRWPGDSISTAVVVRRRRGGGCRGRRWFGG